MILSCLGIAVLLAVANARHISSICTVRLESAELSFFKQNEVIARGIKSRMFELPSLSNQARDIKALPSSSTIGSRKRLYLESTPATPTVP